MEISENKSDTKVVRLTLEEQLNAGFTPELIAFLQTTYIPEKVDPNNCIWINPSMKHEDKEEGVFYHKNTVYQLICNENGVVKYRTAEYSHDDDELSRDYFEECDMWSFPGGRQDFLYKNGFCRSVYYSGIGEGYSKEEACYVDGKSNGQWYNEDPFGRIIIYWQFDDVSLPEDIAKRFVECVLYGCYIPRELASLIWSFLVEDPILKDLKCAFYSQ